MNTAHATQTALRPAGGPSEPTDNTVEKAPANAAEPHFIWPVRVYWEDTDAGGIVFYANYLKFFERARTEWLRARQVEQQALREATGGMFIVAGTELNYLAPARLDDLLHISVELKHMGSASILIHQAATLARTGQRLCQGHIRIGWVNDQNLRPQRMPSVLLEQLQLPLGS